MEEAQADAVVERVQVDAMVEVDGQAFAGLPVHARQHAAPEIGGATRLSRIRLPFA